LFIDQAFKLVTCPSACSSRKEIETEKEKNVAPPFAGSNSRGACFRDDSRLSRIDAHNGYSKLMLLKSK
jgi:hypothetical protein